MDQHELFLEAIRHVAKLCAVAAMTAPKSGGQLSLKGATPFIETVIVEDEPNLKKLASWLRSEGEKHNDGLNVHVDLSGGDGSLLASTDGHGHSDVLEGGGCRTNNSRQPFGENEGLSGTQDGSRRQLGDDNAGQR